MGLRTAMMQSPDNSSALQRAGERENCLAFSMLLGHPLILMQRFSPEDTSSMD